MKLFSKLFAFVPAAERRPWWAGLWHYATDRPGSRIAPLGINYVLAFTWFLWKAIRRPIFARWARSMDVSEREFMLRRERRAALADIAAIAKEERESAKKDF
jgi:hypothetical protein